MKALLLLTVLISGISFAQTNIIAAKSHASSELYNTRDTDNFGLPDETRVVKSVKYLKEDCLIEIVEVTLFDTRIVNDTICDHEYLKKNRIDIDGIKALYPEGTEFIGFDKLISNPKAEKKRLRKEKRRNKKSSLALILFIGGETLFFAYSFIPKTRHTTS